MRLNLISVFATIALAASTASFAAGAPAATKDWTVIVYINGNNSLDSFGTVNLLQMEQIGSTDQVNVVAEWASMERKDTQRMLVLKSTDSSKVTSPVVQDVGNPDMGDYNHLVDFAKWAITNYPAQHYLVDVWDHGSGWHQLKLQGNGARHANDISLDENTGHWITTAQLGVAIGQIAAFLGRPLDVYASDACMMQAAEVAGEMVGSVNVFAGSEETEPGDGWSYADFLKLLTATPTASASDVGKYLTQSYLGAYSSGGLYGSGDTTFAAIDMTAFPAYEASVQKFATAVNALSPSDATKVATAIGSSLGFTYADYVDVSDFLTNLGTTDITDLGDASTAPLKAALGSLIIAGGGTGNFKDRAKGLTMWMPNSTDTYTQYVSAYQALKFDQVTGWSTALKKVLGGK